MVEVFVSNLSVLGPINFVLGLLIGGWPSFQELSNRVILVDADGMQVIMLRGWDPVQIDYFCNHKTLRISCWHKVVAIEGPWHGSSDNPGLLGGRLFGVGKSSYIATDELYKLLKRKGVKPITVDFVSDSNSLVELADLPDRQHIVDNVLRGQKVSEEFVYDTWHAREILPGSGRSEWMRSPLLDPFVEPGMNKKYFNDPEARKEINKMLETQWGMVKDKVRLFQVQTRSSHEFERFIRGDETMLGYQLYLLRTHMKESGRQIPIVVEMLPYWRLETLKTYVDRVKHLLES